MDREDPDIQRDMKEHSENDEKIEIRDSYYLKD